MRENNFDRVTSHGNASFHFTQTPASHVSSDATIDIRWLQTSKSGILYSRTEKVVSIYKRTEKSGLLYTIGQKKAVPSIQKDRKKQSLLYNRTEKRRPRLYNRTEKYVHAPPRQGSDFLPLTLYMLGEIISRRLFQTFFFFFLENRIFDTSCILSPKETICMKCQILFSRRNKKNIISLSSADFFFFFWEGWGGGGGGRGFVHSMESINYNGYNFCAFLFFCTSVLVWQ